MKNYLCINGKKTELTAKQMRQLGIQPEKNYTWDEISRIAREGRARDVFSVNQRFTIQIDGKNAEVEILGFDDDGENTITFGLVNCFMDHRMNHEWFTAGGWHCCEMRKWLNADVFNMLPAELRKVIKTVYKRTGIGAGLNGERVASEDKLFLFSQVEVFGHNRFSEADEGEQYEGFKKGCKKVDNAGDASAWWVRSPVASDAADFCAVGSGGAAISSVAGGSLGVAFGFVV